ncbi:sigma-70 family RNA polymerase sigma factor [Roseibacillus persicicus]|uniref:RNA polymerase sigma factor n=1 Tax=Roseibacillus persicicus TaxID=454148 RepID=UPI00398AEB24
MNLFSRSASKGVMAEDSGATAGGGGEEEQEAESDLELVARSQGGDSRAFEDLVVRHRGRVYAMIQNMVKNEADAWDLSQVVFVKVWKALPKFEARAKFSTWLYRIVHNVVYDWMRKRKLESAGEFDDQLMKESQIAAGARTMPSQDSRPDEALRNDELRVRIEDAMAKLSPEHQEIVLLREVQGMDYKEIADVMEISMGTVMSRLFYARKKLQGLLSDEAGA